MTNPIKYTMKVLYANENYAKYGIRGMNYFMALMGTTFYIMITGFLLLTALSAASPAIYRYIKTIHWKLPDIPSDIVVIGSIFLILRIIYKEEELKDDRLTKEVTRKAVNYLLVYSFIVVLFMLFLGMRFHRHYN